MPNISLADMDRIDKESKSKPKNITLADMDRIDKESQSKPIAKTQSIPSYREEPWRYGQGQMAPMNPEAITDITKGFGQGAYDIVPGLEKKKIGNESVGSQLGHGLANTLALMMPGKAIGAAGKVLEMIPGMNKLFGAIRSGAESNKLLNFGGKALRAGTEGAIGGAMTTPDNRLLGAEVGAPLNLLTQGTIGALGSRNPLVNTLARTAAGGAIGGGIGSMTPYGTLKGAEVGATAGATLPIAAKVLGISRLPPGMEVLNNLKPKDVEKRFEAGLRTGRVLSPSEASGVGRMASPEARYARGGEAAIEKSKISEANIDKEKSQIKSVLNNIYDRSTASNKNISDLYQKAYRWNLKPHVVEKLKQDPVIAKAFNDVKNDAGWKRKLTDVPENNFKYLDAVKKSIGDMEDKLMAKGGKELPKEYGEARRELTKMMDEISPHYKKAREEAQRSIVRSQLQRKLVKTEGRGSDFYNKILKNDDEFDKLMVSLKNAPEAQDQLRDMKTAWKHLINPETPRGVYGKTETGLTQSRNWIDTILETWQNMTGNKKGVEATKFFNSPEWPKAFDRIQKLKDKDQRTKEMLQLLGSMGSAKAASAAPMVLEVNTGYRE